MRLMIAVGYQFGLTGRRNILIAMILALAFSAVVLLIADLDRATQGALQVSQEPMLKPAGGAAQAVITNREGQSGPSWTKALKL